MTLQPRNLPECRPYRESYWLSGFKDGFAGKHEMLPTKNGPFCPVNRGYMNGYRAGWQKRIRRGYP